MNRHKAVAQKLVAQATSLAPHGRCNREALDVIRKRDGLSRIADMLEPVPVLPIAIEQIAITKIGNARAANPREMGKGRCVTACFEREMEPLAAALHGSAVMGRTKENEFAKVARPTMSLGIAKITCAPSNKPAHAVANNDKFLDGGRPPLDKAFQQFGKRAPIGGNMQPRVVVQINRRVAQIARQGRAVIVAVPFPLQVAHAQAMHQYSQQSGQRDKSLRATFLVQV